MKLGDSRTLIRRPLVSFVLTTAGCFIGLYGFLCGRSMNELCSYTQLWFLNQMIWLLPASFDISKRFIRSERSERLYTPCNPKIFKFCTSINSSTRPPRNLDMAPKDLARLDLWTQLCFIRIGRLVRKLSPKTKKLKIKNLNTLSCLLYI